MSSNSSKRLKVDSEDEFEIQSKQNVMSSKERARKHRQRKKQYYKNLEQENINLKDEIKQLNLRIKTLEQEKNSVPKKSSPLSFDDPYKPKLTSLTELRLPQISKLLNLISGEDNSSDNAQEAKEEDDVLKDHLPGFKQDRIPYLREQFKKIMDNVLAIEGQ